VRGHVVSERGIDVDPDKVPVVHERKEPTNLEELRSFLGMTGYYRGHIKDYAHMASPLHALTKKKRTLEVGARQGKGLPRTADRPGREYYTRPPEGRGQGVDIRHGCIRVRLGPCAKPGPRRGGMRHSLSEQESIARATPVLYNQTRALGSYMGPPKLSLLFTGATLPTTDRPRERGMVADHGGGNARCNTAVAPVYVYF
jgi:hypothetical protein